jgi:hypothetical protein
MSAIDDLLEVIFDGERHAIYPEFEDWVRSSRRFKAFATTYQRKIRAKLRNARDEGMEDILAELRTAAHLLQEERFTLEYEKYAALKQRGPDFTVTFKSHTPFNVEVRRIRSVEWKNGDVEARTDKLMVVLCEKVRQMPPSIVNLLWLIPERTESEADLDRAVITLRQLAERKTDDFFTWRGFKSATDFLKQYSKLSGIVLFQPGESMLRLNPLARHKLPPEISTAIQRLLFYLHNSRP